MNDTQTPFEQFAHNASGTSVSMAGLGDALPTAAAFGGLAGDPSTDSLMSYGKLVIAAAGLGMATSALAARRSGKIPGYAFGGAVQAGAVATVIGAFGSNLSNTQRIGFGAVGLGLIAGSWYLTRR